MKICGTYCIQNARFRGNHGCRSAGKLGADDVDDAWTYIDTQCERIHELDTSEPLDLVHDAEKRCKQVQEYSKQRRIPTGFAELDQAMYGGLSTVEERGTI